MKTVHLVHLYPREMNIYGDTGNLLVLEKRLKWRGINVKKSLIGQGEKIPLDADIIIGGGGQDKGQKEVERDLKNKAKSLIDMRDAGVVMLMICGMYQLFGDTFITKDKLTIEGIGLIPIHTEAGDERLIGNINIMTDFGQVVGYENHSGKTWLHEGAIPFGRVIKGYGNNGEDKTEGARVNNVFASYLHGPILSKNTALADGLLEIALSNRGIKLEKLDDLLEKKASDEASLRP